MSDTSFPYDQWVNEALRSVLNRALNQLAEQGFAGDHHFFINFLTKHEDVVIPDFLREQHPEEITIVLQHQYEDLIVEEDRFEVTLSFNGRKQHLVVPYDSVTSFADPSVNFGLQIGVNAVNEAMLQVQDEIRNDDTAGEAEDAQIGGAFPPFPKESLVAPLIDTVGDAGDADFEADSLEDQPEDDTPQTAEVITLDAFRKK